MEEVGKIPVSCVALGSALQFLRCSLPSSLCLAYSNCIRCPMHFNTKRKAKKYEGPYRWVVPFYPHHVPIVYSDERCLKCMGQRKQFEYARHSEDGKEHLKNCKAEPKATQLTGIFPTSSMHSCLWCLRPYLFCGRPGASLASRTSSKLQKKEEKHAVMTWA